MSCPQSILSTRDQSMAAHFNIQTNLQLNIGTPTSASLNFCKPCLKHRPMPSLLASMFARIQLPERPCPNHNNVHVRVHPITTAGAFREDRLSLKSLCAPKQPKSRNRVKCHHAKPVIAFPLHMKDHLQQERPRNLQQLYYPRPREEKQTRALADMKWSPAAPSLLFDRYPPRLISRRTPKALPFLSPCSARNKKRIRCL